MTHRYLLSRGRDMRKALASVLALTLILTFTLALAADETTAPRDVVGTIKKVDAVSNTVTVQTVEMKVRTFTVDAETKITVDGKEGTLVDLKEGRSAKLKVAGGKVLSIEA
jgi:hypothetical protein